MKTLIVIIFLALGGLANAQMVNLEDALKTSETILSIRLQENAILELNRQIFELLKNKLNEQNLLFQDLLDYQKKCYNDSTEMQRGDTLYVNIEFNKPGEPDYMIVTPLYEHKKKPTFEGFIEYMKKKYNIKE